MVEPSSSQRCSGPTFLSGISGRPSLSVGARQSCRCGPSSTSWSFEPSARAQLRGRGRSQLELPPRHLVIAVVEPHRHVVALADIERELAAGRAAPLPPTPRAGVQTRNRLRLWIRKRPPPRCSTSSGAARYLSSYIAGCGVRSGQTSPSAQKFASWRLLAEVAAVGPVVADADPVVDPLPDEAALQRFVAVERGVVVRQAAVAVAHRVRELAQDQRPRIVRVARVRLDRVDVGVHRAHDVGRAVPAGPVARDRALVVQRPSRVALAQPVGGGVVVGAVAALVAERPQDHRRVVLVALDHVAHALDERGGVARVGAQVVVVRVRLDVRLVDRRTGRGGRTGRASRGRSGSASSGPR